MRKNIGGFFNATINIGWVGKNFLDPKSGSLLQRYAAKRAK
jgi:hypothetical protein